ncbi:MAG: hypothetical protein LBI82_11925 [Dysgonamonadaceae bacterium]|jgi:lipopolysaccharide export system protein LptA|nr:hypothetical protein [Dysgonamonadaceae bacterium]
MTNKQQKKIKNGRKVSLTGIFCLFFVCSTALGMIQQNQQKSPAQKTPPTRITLEYADTTSFRKAINPDVHVAHGNVVFKHNDAYLYCDSAYLYNQSNMLEAFDNVRLEQGDSVFIFGDYLIYEGNKNLAKMRYNVRMESGNTTLFTDSLNFDRIINIGYYLGGGMLVDSLNELTSVYGQYSPDTKIAHFKKDVKLTNPQFVLTSDTLKYSTETKIATILGPSVIESDSGVIYSSLGWYNTDTEESMLYKRSTVFNKEKTQSITADSLAYNGKTGFSEAFGNMFMNDTVQKVILTGNYGFLDQATEFAFATDSAQMIDYSQADSLFLHADTLQMRTIDKEREMKAFYGVRFFRNDLQGVCDSLQFNTKDSTLRLYKEPILWNTTYQMTGDTIVIYFNDSTIDRVHIINYAFSVEKIDSTYFNQMKGKDMKVYFVEGEVRLINMSGNAETIFFPLENDGSFIGMNKTESSYFTIQVKDRKPERMVLWPTPKGATIPLPDLTPENKFLKGFIDFEYLRPTDRFDIFIKKQRRAEDVAPPRVNRRHQQED